MKAAGSSTQPVAALSKLKNNIAMGHFARFKSANKSRDIGTEIVCATLQGARRQNIAQGQKIARGRQPKGNARGQYSA